MNRRELLLAVPALMAVSCSGGGSSPATNALVTRLMEARTLWLQQNAGFKWYRMRVLFSSETTGQVWEISSEVFNSTVTPKLISATPELTTEQTSQIFERFSTVENLYDYYIQRAQQLLSNPNVERYDVAISSEYSVPISEELVLRSTESVGQITDRIRVEGYRNIRA